MEEKNRMVDYPYRQYENEIDLRDLIGVLWRQRIVIISLFLVTVLISAILSYFVMSPVYRATTIISLGNYNSNIYTKQAAATEVLTSDDFVISVVKNLDLNVPMTNLKAFKQTIKIESIKETNFLRISVDNTNPREAQAILDKMVTLFIQKSNTDYHKHSDLIKQQLSTVRLRMNDLDGEIDQTRATLAGIEKSSISSVEKDLRRSRTLEYLQGTEEQRLALLDKYLELQKEFDSLQGVEVIRATREPANPIKPNKKLNVTIAGVLGVILGIFVSLSREYLRNNPIKMQERV